MAVTLTFIVAAVVVVLMLLGYVPILWALPAIGVVVAVLLGFMLLRSSAARRP